MAKDLTPKQEAFAVAFFECGSAVEAYRRAYDVAPDAKDHWVYVEAGQLLDHPEITLRLESLKDQSARHSIYTRQKAMDELEAARMLAMGEANPSAAVAAVNSKVKLVGLDRPSKVELTGKDGGPIEVTPDEAFKRLASRLGGVAAGSEGSA
jgi:hypothetical protein